MGTRTRAKLGLTDVERDRVTAHVDRGGSAKDLVPALEKSSHGRQSLRRAPTWAQKLTADINRVLNAVRYVEDLCGRLEHLLRRFDSGSQNTIQRGESLIDDLEAGLVSDLELFEPIRSDLEDTGDYCREA